MDVLLQIQSADPDGFPTQPTAFDRKRFEQWVIGNYGTSWLDAYYGDWEEGR